MSEETKSDQCAVRDVTAQFQIYSTKLNEKHDRTEKLVKLSRDITIEGKRIIFLLHNIDARKNNKDSVLKEAEKRIEKLCSTNIRLISEELKGHDIYQYIRAISPGIQEFIEAFSFLEYLQGKNLSDWEDIEKRVEYDSKEESSQKSFLKICPSEFMLGLADLTGEIMRHCINSLGSGETENCFDDCQFLKKLYSNYLRLNTPTRSRDFSQKIATMKQSLMKTEIACYNLKVRGTEGSKLMSFDSAVRENIDEGFYC